MPSACQPLTMPSNRQVSSQVHKWVFMLSLRVFCSTLFFTESFSIPKKSVYPQCHFHGEAKMLFRSLLSFLSLFDQTHSGFHIQQPV